MVKLDSRWGSMDHIFQIFSFKDYQVEEGIVRTSSICFEDCLVRACTTIKDLRPSGSSIRHPCRLFVSVNVSGHLGEAIWSELSSLIDASRQRIRFFSPLALAGSPCNNAATHCESGREIMEMRNSWNIFCEVVPEALTNLYKHVFFSKVVLERSWGNSSITNREGVV